MKLVKPPLQSADPLPAYPFFDVPADASSPVPEIPALIASRSSSTRKGLELVRLGLRGLSYCAAGRLFNDVCPLLRRREARASQLLAVLYTESVPFYF